MRFLFSRIVKHLTCTAQFVICHPHLKLLWTKNRAGGVEAGPPKSFLVKTEKQAKRLDRQHKRMKTDEELLPSAEFLTELEQQAYQTRTAFEIIENICQIDRTKDF